MHWLGFDAVHTTLTKQRNRHGPHVRLNWSVVEQQIKFIQRKLRPNQDHRLLLFHSVVVFRMWVRSQTKSTSEQNHMKTTSLILGMGHIFVSHKKYKNELYPTLLLHPPPSVTPTYTVRHHPVSPPLCLKVDDRTHTTAFDLHLNIKLNPNSRVETTTKNTNKQRSQ